jgi:hypothetical protein
MTKEQALNVLIKDSDTNKISDGYHTFGELYEHRITLFIALCKAIFNFYPNPPKIWMTSKHSDGSSYAGWFLVGINTESGEQISYHLPDSKWADCCAFAELIDHAPEFDGHTSADVLERLKKL